MKITAKKTWQMTRGTVNRKRKTLNTRVATTGIKRDKTYPIEPQRVQQELRSGGVANTIVKNLWYRSAQQRQQTQCFRQGARNLSHNVQRRSDGLRRSKRQTDVWWPLKRKEE